MEREPKAINFKNLNTSKIETYNAKQIQSFSVTGFEYFRSFNLTVSQGSVEVSNLSQRPDTSSKMDTVFLKVITTGNNLTLFSYIDAVKTRFFILETGNAQPQELIYGVYSTPNEENSIQYINRFRTQLENEAQKYNVNSSSLKLKILQARYDESEIVKIIQNINGSSATQFTQKKLSGTRWFAGLGANYSTLSISGSSTVFSGPGSAKSFFPKGSIGIDFYGNKSIQTIVLRAEASFTVNQFNVSDTYQMSDQQFTTSLNLKQYNTALTPQIIYNFYNKESIKIFFDGGVALNFSSYNKYQTITKFDGTGFAPVIQDEYPAFSKFWFSIPLKIGIRINTDIEISACYIPSSTITSYSELSGNITSYQLSINYLFGK